MGLFDKRKTVEELQAEQISELLERLKAAEDARERERVEHDRKTEQFLATQQDLIHTICLLKGIPFPDVPGDQGAPPSGETKPLQQQRKPWSLIIASKELESRMRAAEKMRQQAQQQGPRRVG